MAEMSESTEQGRWLRAELMSLLSVSGTLAGLCVTGVALFHTVGRGSIPETLADDALSLAAFLFLLCTYVIFVALRTKRVQWARALERAVDILLLVALTAMVIAGFIMTYTVW